MENSKSEELISGLVTAFIDQSGNSNLAYRPEFVYNDHKQGKKVLVSLEQELKRCDEFFISVAFITDSGFESLSMILKELEQKGIPGKILTTDYLTFSQPKALDRLAQLKNIELKMFRTNSEVGGFHTKGYIFREDELYRIIIGSSNMTSKAITENREWNTKIVSTEQGEVAQEILNEFKNLWMSPNSQYYEEFIEDYKEQYLQNQIIKKQQRQAAKEQIVDFESYKLKPNKMQLAFINNLMEMRSEGIEKALLLSSTGTGKTYASAFAVRELGYQKVLFLVHRNQIAEQALKSYQKVFGPSVTMGLVTGKSHDYGADFIFATVQTLSKTENLERFARHHFECCIYDEAHHTSADSYKKVMDYFTPQFTLGMTATPDKRDDHIEGRNIYEIFDHNIAYEIRLQKAMEEDLLCPFHYFGISDLWVDTQVDISDMEVSFSNLSTKERVDKIIEKIRYFGHSGSRVKGLVFCSNRVEAKALSDAFNERGVYRTVCLTGEDSQETREIAIARLTGTGDYQGRPDLQLDYIFTVDIFNEGVDIPEINQVIMLRQTESPIIFIQQLGRGLRKFEDKEYVVILDFIGNYTNNFMIPLALSGDRSYNKDTLRRYVQAGNRIIPGTSTVHFDKIAKQRIYESIDTARFSDMKLIKEAYFNLRFKLGRIPKISDFADHGSIDVSRIFSKFKSYHHFLIKIKDKDYDISFTPVQERMLHFISQKLTTGMRVREILLLQALLDGRDDVINYVTEELLDSYNVDLSEYGRINLINMMTNQFGVQVAQKTFADSEFIEFSNGSYGISQLFKQALEDNNFKEQVQELVDYGLKQFDEKYKDNIYGNTPFALYEKYTYEQ